MLFGIDNYGKIKLDIENCGMINIDIDKCLGIDLDTENYAHRVLEDRYGETSPKACRKVLWH